MDVVLVLQEGRTSEQTADRNREMKGVSAEGQQDGQEVGVEEGDECKHLGGLGRTLLSLLRQWTEAAGGGRTCWWRQQTLAPRSSPPHWLLLSVLACCGSFTCWDLCFSFALSKLAAPVALL